jgi:hypothetical protein
MFCIDKVTLLLQMQKPPEILDRLRQDHPEAVEEHRGLLAHE